jgi:transposase-like protein
MASRESVNEVFLPDKEDCLEYLREQRWPDGVTCPHCESADTIKKGTTRKGAQSYRCQACESIFNDLTGAVFADHQLTLPEMFHTIRGMEEHRANEIFQELDRTDKTVLDFVHEGQDTRADDPECALPGGCDADAVYDVVGGTGLEAEDGSPRSRGLAKKDAEPSNQTNHLS